MNLKKYLEIININKIAFISILTVTTFYARLNGRYLIKYLEITTLSFCPSRDDDCNARIEDGGTAIHYISTNL